MTDIKVRYSWNQPMCTACWYLHNPGRTPACVKNADAEICVFCGQATKSGIFIRIDPKNAPFPSRLKD